VHHRVKRIEMGMCQLGRGWCLHHCGKRGLRIGGGGLAEQYSGL
jgi:hypothetical protein